MAICENKRCGKEIKPPEVLFEVTTMVGTAWFCYECANEFSPYYTQYGKKQRAEAY